jgi:DNA-binding transcriptional MerR regulator
MDLIDSQTLITPTFNMKAVVQETGLKPDTLRAWERRYNLPRPERTEGGHRLYSRRDIDTVKWLVSRQKEGLSISHAAEMWFRIESQDRDPLAESVKSTVTFEPAKEYSIFSSGEMMNELQQDWLLACTSFNESEAERILAQSFAVFPPESVCIELLQKSLAQIGERWYQGDISVQQEHFASELAIRRIESLIAAAPAPIHRGRLLIACPRDEEHTFASLLLTYLLRRSGWEATFLGANVPLEQLKSTLDAIKPQLVILSAQTLVSASSLFEVAELLSKMGYPVAYGGRIFNALPQLSERIPGYFLGERLDRTVGKIAELQRQSQEPVITIKRSGAYDQALSHFRDRQAALENAVSRNLAAIGREFDAIGIAKRFLGRNIVAALILGDINFLEPELKWISGYLDQKQNFPSELSTYLQGYSQALNQVLDERGEPIVSWFLRSFE